MQEMTFRRFQLQTFFSQESVPTKAPQNVMFDRSGEYVNVSWDALTLSEARGFPVYTVTLTPSVSSDVEQFANEVITENTTQSSIVVGGLDFNVEYMLTVAVGTVAGQVVSDGGTQMYLLLGLNACTVIEPCAQPCTFQNTVV